MKVIIKFTILFLLFTNINSVLGQTRIDSIRNRLEELSKTVPGLNEKVEFSVDGASVQELISAIGKAHNINVTVDPLLTATIYNSFRNISVLDVFVFLCSNYKLDIHFYDQILSFSAYNTSVARNISPPRKELNINYDSVTAKISLDLSNDTLSQVFKKISKLTGYNFSITPGIKNKIVSGYFQNSIIKQFLGSFAASNDLNISETDNGYYTIEPQDKGEKSSNILKGTPGNNRSNSGSIPEGLTIKVLGGGKANLQANNVAVIELIKSLAYQLHTNYYLINEVKGNVSITMDNVGFKDVLDYIMQGTDINYQYDGSSYIVGDKTQTEFKTLKVIQLQNRTVDKLIEIIPPDLKKNLEIKEFSDQNSIILNGARDNVNVLASFIQNIDRVVPVVQIDVVIIDVENSTSLSTGIQAGLGNQPAQTGGTIFPNADLTLSSQSVNDLISGINGLGVLNLGKVTPNFYLTLKAMETQGFLKIRSTPKLATLNGNEATMSIGQTQYYLETTNSVIGSLNTQNIVTQQYKSVDANLSVTIKPIVSGDEQITLTVTVNQSTFTTRISPSAPPGKITRNFQSLLRVKNQEMILLGGLEEETSNDSGSGTPFLSRIPIIKWFFSSRTKIRSKNKLIVLIRPTVIY